MTFSHAIQAAPVLDTGNWFVRWADIERVIDSVDAGGGVVWVRTSAGPLIPGPDVVSFTPPPFDVISDTAVPVPAPGFVNFPVHA